MLPGRKPPAAFAVGTSRVPHRLSLAVHVIGTLRLAGKGSRGGMQVLRGAQNSRRAPSGSAVCVPGATTGRAPGHPPSSAWGAQEGKGVCPRSSSKLVHRCLRVSCHLNRADDERQTPRRGHACDAGRGRFQEGRWASGRVDGEELDEAVTPLGSAARTGPGGARLEAPAAFRPGSDGGLPGGGAWNTASLKTGGPELAS